MLNFINKCSCISSTIEKSNSLEYMKLEILEISENKHIKIKLNVSFNLFGTYCQKGDFLFLTKYEAEKKTTSQKLQTKGKILEIDKRFLESYSGIIEKTLLLPPNLYYILYVRPINKNPEAKSSHKLLAISLVFKLDMLECYENSMNSIVSPIKTEKSMLECFENSMNSIISTKKKEKINSFHQISDSKNLIKEKENKKEGIKITNKINKNSKNKFVYDNELSDSKIQEFFKEIQQNIVKSHILEKNEDFIPIEKTVITLK